MEELLISEKHEVSTPFADSESFQKYMILEKCLPVASLYHRHIKESLWTAQLL